MTGKHKFISVTLQEVAQILGVPTGDVYHAYQCGDYSRTLQAIMEEQKAKLLTEAGA